MPLPDSTAHCLPFPTQMRAMDRKSVKFEKTKNEKCGSHMWSDVSELAQLIRCASHSRGPPMYSMYCWYLHACQGSCIWPHFALFPLSHQPISPSPCPHALPPSLAPCLTCLLQLLASASLTCRDGKTKWEDLDLDDVDVRLKWSGLFHRRKRTPGRFMMRLKVPNGELTAAQLRYLGDCIAPYGADGCADITTRANMQVCWVC